MAASESLNKELSWGTRGFRIAASALSVLLTVSLISACTPEAGTGSSTDLYQLHVDMTTTGFSISWNQTLVGSSNGYHLQVRKVSAPATDWSTITTPTNGSTSASYTSVIGGAEYQFRVGERPDVNVPATQFSSPVTAWYVTLRLPVIRIDTENHAPVVSKDDYLSSTVTISPNGSAFPAFSGAAGVKGRGNSTWNQPKKPYAVKLNTKASLMGMPAAKSWVLLANYMDKSQLRTFAATQISEATDLAWTPGFRWVELILNGTYMGMYQLAEKVEIGSSRINIDEMESTDTTGENLTGGYLLEMDGHRPAYGDPGWATPRGTQITVKDPEPWAQPQFNYISTYVNTFESTLFSSTFANPTTGYAKYLDVASFVDYWITQEATKNADSFWSSTYFYKPRSEAHMKFGPIWDHDQSIGAKGTTLDQNPTGWLTPVVRPWVQRMFQDPAFVNRANTRWTQLLPAISAVPNAVRSAAPALEGAKSNDMARWKYTMPANDTPDFIATWLQTRINWITTNLGAWANQN